eukprot:jgi/Picsp_1/2554/NSC_00785-R1_transferase family protein
MIISRIRECFVVRDAVTTEIIKPAKSRQGAENRESVPLSPADYYSAPFSDVVMSFVFRGRQYGQEEGDRLDVEGLKASLSMALAEQPYLAGHVTLQEDGEFGSLPSAQGKTKGKRPEKLKLEYSDRGIEWTTKVSRSSRRTVARLLPFIQFSDAGNMHNIVCSTFDLPKLAPYYYRKVEDSTRYWKRKEYLMRVQLTQLVDGGSVLVVSVSHLLTDLQPIKLLLRSWSSHYTLNKSQIEGQLEVTPKISIDQSDSTVQHYLFERSRPILDSMTASSDGKNPDAYEFLELDKTKYGSWVDQGTKIFRSPWLSMLRAKSRFRAVHITRSQLDRARQRTIEQIKPCNNTSVSWVSDNDILTATVWKLMAKRAPADDIWMLNLVCNMRKRLQPPIPQDAWGNCFHIVSVGFIKRSDAKKSIPELAAQVRESLNRLCSDKFDADVATAAHILLEEHEGIPNLTLNTRYIRLNILNLRIPMLLTNWDFSRGFKNEVNFADMTPVWMQPEDLIYSMLCIVTPCSSHIRDAGYILTFQVSLDAYKPRKEEFHQALVS